MVEKWMKYSGVKKMVASTHSSRVCTASPTREQEDEHVDAHDEGAQALAHWKERGKKGVGMGGGAGAQMSLLRHRKLNCPLRRTHTHTHAVQGAIQGAVQGALEVAQSAQSATQSRAQ